jgi:hypothetical protein
LQVYSTVSLRDSILKKFLPLSVTNAGLACMGRVEPNTNVDDARRVSLRACGSAHEPPSWEITMSIMRRFARYTILLLSLEFLSVIPASVLAHAATPLTTRWNAVKSRTSERVQILVSERRRFYPSLPTLVITHGMGGTQSEDRFHQLSDAFEAAIPSSNVILLDWSKDAKKTTSFLGHPAPWDETCV